MRAARGAGEIGGPVGRASMVEGAVGRHGERATLTAPEQDTH